MEKFSSYKDSGVKWLGEIPEGWEMRKTLFCLSMPITDGPHETPQLHEEGIPFVSAEAVSCGNGRIDFDYIRGYISKEFYNECCKKYIPKLHDIYMIKSGATTGKVALVDSDRIFTIWSPLAVFRCDESIMYYDYMFYVLQSTLYQQQVQLGWSYGTQQNIGMRTLEKLKVPVPPFNEQQNIASFLDNIVGKIDEIIAQQKKMIELLNERKQIIINNAVTKGLDPNVKMKDSGVDWIGEIPEGWEVISIKHIIKFINGYAFDSNKFKNEGEIPVIRIGDISEGKINLDDIVYVSRRKELDSYLTKQGDLLIAMSGATTGKVGFDTTGGKYINQRVGAIRSNNQKLVFYWLNSTYFKEYVLLSALGSAQPNISSNGISNFQICLPKEGDINSIVLYIEEEIGKIDQIVKVAQKQITLLQERKQIIINEVVTGKVKVS